MENNFNHLLNDLKCFGYYDLKDIRKSIARYGLMLNNVIKEYDKILDLMHDIIKFAELQRNDRNFLKVGVYEVTRQKKKYTYYHLVSNRDYHFKNVINGNWVLINTFELDTPRPITINRIVIDFDFWVSNNI